MWADGERRGAASAIGGMTLGLWLVAAVPLTAATPTLIWSDEFDQADGSAPDPASWSYDLGRGNPVGWGNNELETYTDARENVDVVSDSEATDGHALVIRAQQSGSTYTSARLLTAGKRTFTSGRMEARLKMPRGRGLWPAFWALGANIGTVGWPACGEIDAMEWVGPVLGNGTIAGTLHASGYSGGSALSGRYSLPSPATFSDAYHVFAVDRYPDRIVFSVDGVVYEDRQKSAIPAGSQWPFDQPFFVLLNLAVGGNWPGPPDATTSFPQEYRVDYVRVYDLPATPPTDLVYSPAAPEQLQADNTSPGHVGLSWPAPVDTFGAPLTGYRLERATNATFSTELLARTLAPDAEFTDTGLRGGRTYYYRVAAMTANGTSEFSPAATTELLVSAGSADHGTRMVNLSTRAFVGSGSQVEIAGLAIVGTETRRVLVRAIGPGLIAHGVPDPVPDPVLTLYDQSTGQPVANNDNWDVDNDADVIRQSAAATGAFALENASLDAAIVVDLPPGVYTAVVEGRGGATGVALVEAYEVPATSS